MIYLSLFLEFLKIGAFAFGGAYGAIPLIQESVISRGWMDVNAFADIIAISESTPGPIMVNAATYIGSSQAGFWGAAAATIGVVLPSFILILLITAFLQKKLSYVQPLLKGIKPSLMGIILATGIFMLLKVFVTPDFEMRIDYNDLVICIILGLAILASRLFMKKPVSPILLIILAGLSGILLY